MGAGIDVAALKDAARGRWHEILVALGGIDAELLDGQHHPCPRCGGTDRFRLVDRNAGACRCNQCRPDRCGDGIAALQWLRDWPFKEACKELAEYLGMAATATNGKAANASKNKTPAPFFAGKLQFNSNERLGDVLDAWATKKPPIKPDAALQFRPRLCRPTWDRDLSSLDCIGFQARDPRKPDECRAVLLYRQDNEKFPPGGKRKDPCKMINTPGSKDSWVWPGEGAAAIEEAKVIVCTEGLPDAMAVLSLGLPVGWTVITNACGAGSAKGLHYGFAKGSRVAVFGDADKPGMDGAAKKAEAFARAGASVVRPLLPYPIEESHGKDLRDWLAEGNGLPELVALIEAADDSGVKAEALAASELFADEARTELANARRLVTLHGENLRYVDQWKTWLCWDGSRWAPDRMRQVESWARSVPESLWEQLAKLGKAAVSSDQEKALSRLAKFCMESSSSRGIAAMIGLARAERGIALAPEAVDRDPWLLNVRNGTVDLRTGGLRPHDKLDCLTKIAPVDYHHDAEAPRWREFLEQIFAGNRDLIRYVQRCVGFSLTGRVDEHVLFLCHGSGRNGKSTFLNTLMRMLGSDFSMKAPPDMLMSRKGEVHPTERADLFGKRFVAAVETEDGKRLAESLVKELTGGDIIRARRMKQDFFQFEPTHKIWLASNYLPIVRGQDTGIWRRLRRIPFTVTLAEGEQDKQLGDTLAAEAAGILNWALLGCLDWQRQGLAEPFEIQDATSTYRSAMDVFGGFLQDVCIEDEAATVRLKDLRDAYESWCGENRHQPATARAFSKSLRERGYESFTSDGTFFRGLTLSDAWLADHTSEEPSGQEAWR